MSLNSDTVTTEAIAAHCTLDPDAKHDPHATRFGKFLQACIKFEGSDLLLKTGTTPRVRLRGALKTLDTEPISHEEFISIAKHILTEEQFGDLHKYGSVDFAYDYDEAHRFRINLFQARGKISVAARLITSNIRKFDELYLPEVMAEIAMQPQGIVLLAGVTGSGKSTTIASMLDYVNERKPVHIVTLEDPIEYIFTDKKATINQREIGIDCLDFKTGLRALVRENPDIVLVGEMRDSETFEAALHAAETGHLVFGTIHASSATETFSRIYDLFPPDEREQVRKILAYQMRAIVYQKLLPTLHKDIHRIPAVEILINTPPVRKYILEGRESEIRDIIKSQEAEQIGMIDFNGCLVKLVEQEYIHTRVAMETTPNADELRMRLKGITEPTGGAGTHLDMTTPLTIADSFTALLGAEGYFLVSPYKPVLFLAPFGLWAWVVATILDKDAARWYFKRENWNFVHIAAGLIAASVVLLAPLSFWITWPIMIAILGADVGIYAMLRNKDERVPEVFKWSLDLEKMRQARAAKAAAKKSRQVTMAFRDAKGKELAVPEKESPQYAVRAHAETLIQNLFDARGSELEIVPTRDKQYRVMFVIDGLRQPVEQLGAPEGAAIIDLFKSAAGLDIEDRRRKQKGTLSISRPNAPPREARVSALGGSAGMQLSMLLDPEQQVKRRVEELGLFPNQLDDLKALTAEMSGVVLLGAPRDNGGTSTLYALVRAHDAYTSNVQTVEMDPQTQIEGVRHNAFSAEQGGEYSTTVRSVLRRDPNVVAVAECDDATAKEIARADTRTIRVYVQMPSDGAVNTIQTWTRAVGDAKSAAACLQGVIAQRLVRKLCTNCRVPYQPTPDVLKKLGLPAETKQLFRKGGQVLIKDKPDTCPVCAGAGFHGQVGLFAVHTLNQEDRELIRAGNFEGLRASFRQKKQQSIQTAGLQHILVGDTSVEELVRVIQGPQQTQKKTESASRADVPTGAA